MMEILKYIRWLSLDIVLGGVIFLNFIGDQLNVEVPIAVSLALAVCIWLIYTLDHQRDVRHKLHQKGARRIFHKKNQKAIIVTALFVGLLGLTLLFYLPLELIQSGLFVALMCLVYLILSAGLSAFLVKEIIVALLYGGGVFLFPLIQMDQLDGIHGLLWMQLALLAFVNIVLISTFELEEDRFNEFGSLSLSMGKKRTFPITGRITHYFSTIYYHYRLLSPLFYEFRDYISIFFSATCDYLIAADLVCVGRALSYLCRCHIFLSFDLFMVKENDFDGIAWCYDFMAKLIFGERLYQASIQWLETLNKSDTVVVLGGGSGKILKQLTHVDRVIFIEKSAKMIKLAQTSTPANVQFIYADFLEYALEDESTHIVICPFFLDVFTPFQLGEVLDKIARILKKKGTLFVSDFQYTTWWSKQLIKLMYVFFGMSTRIASTSTGTLKYINFS